MFPYYCYYILTSTSKTTDFGSAKLLDAPLETPLKVSDSSIPGDLCYLYQTLRLKCRSPSSTASPWDVFQVMTIQTRDAV